MRRAVIIVLPLLAASCAPPGYHYGTWGSGQAFTLQSNDACRDPRLVSPGAIRTMNLSVGKPNGLPKPVASVTSVSSTGYGPSLGYSSGPSNINCYETIVFTDGSQQNGEINFLNQDAGVDVQWTPEPPPITPQQAARNALAGERYQDELGECSADYDAKTHAMGDLSLQAQANGTTFDGQSYLRDAVSAMQSCQQGAQQRYQSVTGGN